MKKSLIKAPFLPRGTEDFAKMRQWQVGGSGLTIADKTGFLPELLDSGNEVSVFTRPIRFMKSSTLSMLEKFLSIQDAENNQALFQGLVISNAEHAEFRSRYQGQFPIIHLTYRL